MKKALLFHRISIIWITILIVLITSNFVYAFDPEANIKCCEPGKCYVLVGNMSQELWTARFGKTLQNAVGEAVSDCKDAGLETIEINPATRENFKKAIQDPCTKELVMFGHGPGKGLGFGFIQAAGNNGGIGEYELKEWLKEAFGKEVHPCTKKLIIHSCGNKLDIWKKLFGIDDDHFFAWRINTQIFKIFWWQFFHSQKPEAPDLKAMPGQQHANSECIFIDNPEEIDKSVREVLEPQIKALADGSTNIYASDSNKQLFLAGVYKKDGKVIDVVYSELKQTDRTSTISRDYLFELMDTKPIGRQFKELCGNSELDRGEQCDFGYDCPNGMICSDICDCIYPGQGNSLPQKNESQKKYDLAYEPEKPQGLFARLFAMLRKFFKTERNPVKLIVEAKNTRDEVPQDNSKCPGEHDDLNCYNYCRKNSVCEANPDKAGCYRCNAICANDEYYKEDNCAGLCVEGVNKCVASDKNSDCYWCQPISKKVAFVVNQVNVSQNYVLIGGNIEGNTNQIKYVMVNDLFQGKTESYSLAISKDKKQFTFKEKLGWGKHILTIEADLTDGERIRAKPVQANVEQEKCTGNNIYKEFDCLNACHKFQKCTPRDYPLGCYGCEAVCANDEYYNDPNCAGVCTQGVNKCEVSKEEVPCFMCKPLTNTQFNFEFKDVSQDYKQVSSLIYGHKVHFVVASNTADVRLQLPITIAITVKGEEVFKAKIPNDPVGYCRDATGCSIDGPVIDSSWQDSPLFVQASNKDGKLLVEHKQ